MYKYDFKTISEIECKQLVNEKFGYPLNEINIIGVDSRCITFNSNRKRYTQYLANKRL